MTTTTLLFARHGETADNANKVFQGQSGRGLNALGRSQASRLADRMRRAELTAIVASDLERAVETARIVGQACGLEPTLDRELREVDVGAWTGKSYADIARLFPEEWAAWTAGLDVRRGGGETYAELGERMERAAARIVAANAGGRVLVVSHGGAIRSYVTKLLGLTTAGMRVLGGVGNCSITVVQRARRDGADADASRLHTWNDEAHLEGMPVVEEAD